LGWYPAARLQPPEADVPQVPLDEQQSPNALYRYISFVLEAAPHLPLVDTGVQLPYFVWHPSRPAQNAGVLPHVPAEPQQLPKVLPAHVVLLLAAPHLPLVEMGRTPTQTS
jgi:hypothetical protein